MDLSNPWSLLTGLFLGLVGMALFMYGKRQADAKCLLGGVVLCVVPYFVASVLALWLIAAGVLGGLWALAKYA